MWSVVLILLSAACLLTCSAADSSSSIMLVIANRSSTDYNSSLVQANLKFSTYRYLLNNNLENRNASEPSIERFNAQDTHEPLASSAFPTAKPADRAPLDSKSGKEIDVYTVIAIGTAGVVLISFMATTLIIYKMRVNYLLQRQLNQFRRVEAQLRLDSLSELVR